MNAPAARLPILKVFSDLLERRTGQRLSAERSWRIETAMRPLFRELGVSDLESLAKRLVLQDEKLGARITDALLNNETSFFRDMKMFQLLGDGPLSTLAKSKPATQKKLSFWSAGCSTGQEAYTLAMILRDQGAEWEGWTFDILATDISASAVARGRAGRYSQFEIQRGLPVRIMLSWFEQQKDDWVIDPKIRRSVRYATHNLLLPPPGHFDVILCRNVLMYFLAESRARIFNHLADALNPGGILMLGAGETVIGQTSRFRPHSDWRGFYAATDERRMGSAGTVVDVQHRPRA